MNSFVRTAVQGMLPALLGAAALSLAWIAPVSAAAIVTRDSVTTPIYNTGLPDDCRAGHHGDDRRDGRLRYQIVETAAGFHREGTFTDTGRIDWSDGSYSIIESIDHLTRNIGPGADVRTVAHEDSGNTYTADGVFLFRDTLHAVDRFTITDGVVRVEFERGQFHFFGDC